MSDKTSVVLVEDDALLRESLAEYLALAGLSVSAVGDGSAYCRLVSERPFSVAVIDLGLPGLPGEFLVDFTRRNTSSAIVVITSRDTLETRLSCYRAGADLFLGKPVEGRDLAAAVATAATLAVRRAAEA